MTRNSSLREYLVQAFEVSADGLEDLEEVQPQQAGTREGSDRSGGC